MILPTERTTTVQHAPGWGLTVRMGVHAGARRSTSSLSFFLLSPRRSGEYRGGDGDDYHPARKNSPRVFPVKSIHHHSGAGFSRWAERVVHNATWVWRGGGIKVHRRKCRTYRGEAVEEDVMMRAVWRWRRRGGGGGGRDGWVDATATPSPPATGDWAETNATGKEQFSSRVHTVQGR